MAKRRTVRIDAEVWARMQEILRRLEADRHERAKVRERLAYVQGYLTALHNRSR